MRQKHNYVLGLNAYDHDVSACLLRDGEIAFAIAKDRITRNKHDSGYYQEVVDYCLSAEGITIDDVDLVVRDCYVLPIHEMERWLLTRPLDFPDEKERILAAKDPLFLRNDGKVVTVSHHLAHAYSAFAACPFDEGVVMIVDGVGSYRSTSPKPIRMRTGRHHWLANRRAIMFQRIADRCAEEDLDGTEPRIFVRTILHDAGAWCLL